MRLAFRLFFYTVLALVVVVWIALGLFKAEYLKAPLSQWIEQQTGQPLTIGRIEFNPFYPNVMLLEQIKLGDSFSADKLYIEVANGTWWTRRIELAHLDVIGARLQLAPGQRWPGLPLQALRIRDLNAERLTILSPTFELGNASLQISQWQPLQQGTWSTTAPLTITGQAKRLNWQGLEMANLEVDGEQTDDGWKASHLQAQLLDGRLTTALRWQPKTGLLRLTQPLLQGMRLTSTLQPILPVQQLEIRDGDFRNLTLSQPDHRLTLNNLNLKLPHLTWHRGSGWQGSVNGSLGELALADFPITAIQGELTLQPDRWQGALQASLWEGSLQLSGAFLPAEQTLDLNSVTLADWQAELPADWRQRDVPLPVQRLQLHRLDGKRLSLLSYDDQLPLSLKGADIFLTDLDISRTSIGTLSDKSRGEFSWGELAYGPLVSRRGELQGELTAAQWRLKALRAPLDNGELQAEGLWSRDGKTPHALTLRARNFPLASLYRFWHPQYEVSGLLDFNAELQATGDQTSNWLTTLQGTIALQGKDLFIDQLQFDSYLDGLSNRLPAATSFEALKPTLLGAGTGINQLMLALQLDKGQAQVSGGIATISHLLAPSGSIALSDASWQLTLDVLNRKRCADLQISIQGRSDNPQLSVALPKGCPDRSAGEVPYPPQGRLGSLRPEPQS